MHNTCLYNVMHSLDVMHILEIFFQNALCKAMGTSFGASQINTPFTLIGAQACESPQGDMLPYTYTLSLALGSVYMEPNPTFELGPKVSLKNEELHGTSP